MNLELSMNLVLALKEQLLEWLASLPEDEILVEEFEGKAMSAGEMRQEIEAGTDLGRRMLEARLQTALMIGLHEMASRE